jgi:MFS family permease
MTAFALALGANEGQIGIITSARRIASFYQSLTNHLLERIGGKRPLYYCVYGGSRTVRLLVAFLPSILLALVSHNTIWWLVFMLFVIGCADSIGMVLKKTWLSELTPPDIRGRYFGSRNLFIDAFGMFSLDVGAASGRDNKVS